MEFNEIEREIPSETEVMKVKLFLCFLETLPCSHADRMEEGRITCGSMRACVHKVQWLSMEIKVPPDRREFMHVEVPLVTVEAGSPLRKIGEEVTLH
jgi:hypothetical protein